MIEINKIYNEDCLDGMKRIPSKSVDADPPYLYLKHKLDRPFNEQAIFNEWDRILKDDGFIVIFGRGESFYRWNYMLNQMGWKFKEEIVWDKRYSSSPVLPIQRMHETVSLMSKTGKVNRVKVPYIEIKQYQLDRMQNDLKRIVSGLGNQSSFSDMCEFLNNGTHELKQNLEHQTRYATTISKTFKDSDRATQTIKSITLGQCEQSIVEIARDGRKSIKHPTQKPVRLMERLINLVSDEDNVILDPFIGSGSTTIACINTNRNYIGFEIDESYFLLAQERIVNHQSDSGGKDA